MAYTYSKIATVTVGSSGANSIAFLAIPQNYTDLILKTSLRGDSTLYGGLQFNVWATFNGSSSNFIQTYLEGAGSGAPTSGLAPGQRMIGSYNGASSTANIFASTDVYIPNYSSDKYKSFSYDAAMENNATAAYADLVTGLWSSSAPINSIILNASYGNFVQYSTATLYGIKAEV